MIVHLTPDPSIARTDAGRRPYRSDAPIQGLPAAQQRICRLVSQGLSNQQIADDLGIALSTVRNALYLIYRQHGIRNRTELALWCLECEV